MLGYLAKALVKYLVDFWFNFLYGHFLLGY